MSAPRQAASGADERPFTSMSGTERGRRRVRLGSCLHRRWPTDGGVSREGDDSDSGGEEHPPSAGGSVSPGMNTDAERCGIFSQPAAARILHVADDRQAVGLVPFLAGSSVAQRPDTTAIAMDMREPHRKTLRTHVPDAVATVVFDKCHVMPHGNTAVETVRKRAHRALAADGPSPLTRTTCAWLRNPVSLSATAGRAVRHPADEHPPDGSGAGDEGAPAAPVGLHLPRCASRLVPPLVRMGHAAPPRADDRRCPNAPRASRQHPASSTYTMANVPHRGGLDLEPLAG